MRYKLLVLSGVGGILYIALELAWRGQSHWTMFVLGGLCFLSLGLINEVLPWQMPLWQQAFIGACLIAVLEFITGCVVNRWLGWGYGTIAGCEVTSWDRYAHNTSCCGCQ